MAVDLKEDPKTKKESVSCSICFFPLLNAVTKEIIIIQIMRSLHGKLK